MSVYSACQYSENTNSKECFGMICMQTSRHVQHITRRGLKMRDPHNLLSAPTGNRLVFIAPPCPLMCKMKACASVVFSLLANSYLWKKENITHCCKSAFGFYSFIAPLFMHFLKFQKKTVTNCAFVSMMSLVLLYCAHAIIFYSV